MSREVFWKRGQETGNGVRLRYFVIFILRPSTRFFSKPMSFSLNPSSSLIRFSTFAIPGHNETGLRTRLPNKRAFSRLSVVDQGSKTLVVLEVPEVWRTV